jgi:hypothetical protein
MDVALDVPAVPITDEQTKVFLFPRAPREEISIEKTELTQEMIAAQPPLPDPVFEPNDFCPCVYEVGAPLNRLDDHDTEFKKMIEQMFESGPELRLTKEGIEAQTMRYDESTIEITLPMVENE